MVLQNRWTSHRFALSARTPAGKGDPLDVRARFSHPAFGARPSDATRWKGELYADLRNTDLAAWKQYFDYPFTLQRAAARCAPGSTSTRRAWPASPPTWRWPA
jgi:hypothetical protein